MGAGVVEIKREFEEAFDSGRELEPARFGVLFEEFIRQLNSG